MQLEIITPEKTVFQGTVNSVILPGTAGSFGVLNNHAAMISTLEKGELVFETEVKIAEPKQFTVVSEKQYQYAIKGGVVEVLDNKIIVLAD
ncbi:MAG: F0F1 ATP synthase subunit epsilon [Luteibaculaceae bacterium]